MLLTIARRACPCPRLAPCSAAGMTSRRVLASTCVGTLAAALASLPACAPPRRPVAEPGRLVPPRLVVRAPYDVRVEGHGGSRRLRFAMAVENRGEGALELVGRDAGGERVAAQQVLAVGA